MSAIVGKGILSAGGGGELNIAYGLTPPTDTSKLWVRMQGKPDTVESTDDVAVQVGEFVEYFSQDDLSPLAGHVIFNVPSGRICNGKMYTAINENFSIFNVTDLETKITSLNSVHRLYRKGRRDLQGRAGSQGYQEFQVRERYGTLRGGRWVHHGDQHPADSQEHRGRTGQSGGISGGVSGKAEYSGGGSGGGSGVRRSV